MADENLHVLVVCTANVVRSPMAHAMLEHRAREAGLGITVDSAGLDPTQRPVHPLVVRLLAERDLTPAKAQSDPVDDDRIERADLVITMTGAQAIETAARHRLATRRVFVFDHAARVLPALVGRARAEWLAEVATIPRSYPRHPDTVDVPDPINGPESAFRAVGNQLERLCDDVVAALRGPA